MSKSSRDNYNLYRYEHNNFIGRYGGTNILMLLNDDFELIEDEIDIDSIEKLENEVMRDDWRYYVPMFFNKINELVQAVK